MAKVWTAEVDVRLFLTILAVHNISIDYQRVAAEMNMTSSAIVQRMFKLRQKAKQIESGQSTAAATDDGTNAAGCKPKAPRRARPAKNADAKPKATKGKAAGKAIKKEDTDDEPITLDAAAETLATPAQLTMVARETTPDLTPDSGAEVEPVTPKTPNSGHGRSASVVTSTARNKVLAGRVEKKRASPRNANKHVSYADLQDPFRGVSDSAALLGMDGPEEQQPGVTLGGGMITDDVVDSDGDFVQPSAV